MPILSQIKIELEKRFNKLGQAAGTEAPQDPDNRAKIVHEYFVADRLASFAEKRKKNAKAACVEAGIISSEYDPDTIKEIYSNDYLTMTAKTANPAQRIDPNLLRAKLLVELGADKAAKIIAAATVDSKPATSFIFAEK